MELEVELELEVEVEAEGRGGGIRGLRTWMVGQRGMGGRRHSQQQLIGSSTGNTTTANKMPNKIHHQLRIGSATSEWQKRAVGGKGVQYL